MSDDTQVEEKVEDVKEEVKEKTVKRDLPKLDNVDDALAGDRAAALIEHVVMSLVEHKDKAELARAVGSAEDRQVGVEVVDPNRPQRNERSNNDNY